jgi:signal transduction histidine kinase/CheY-like chemotaxis protein
LQHRTDALGVTFNNAFERGAAILLLFLVLTVVLILMMFSDISQSNKYKIQLIAAKEKAEQLEQIKHRFLSNMSHEIRTPLQVIIGFSEQMNSKQNPDKMAVKAISKSSEYLLQIVNEILDYNRIVSGKFVLVKDSFDMERLVAEVAGIMGSQAEKKNLLFKFKSQVPRDALYHGDSFRLKQVLFNLLANAIKFTDQGHVLFSTTIRDINKQATEFTFEIADTGIGMSEKEQEHIFDSFEQASESIERKYGGTGLGLAIVKTVTDMLKGRISVSSEVNRGSSFSLTFVLEKTDVIKDDLEKISCILPIIQSEKVLIVDDDKFILQLCETILEKNGVEHVCCSTPAELLLSEWDDAVTVVLIDMRMPDVGGSQLFSYLRSRCDRNVRFIALTALALPEEEQSILTIGFDAVLLKPFREKDLLNVILKTEVHDISRIEVLCDRFDTSSIWQMCENDDKLFNKNLDIFVEQTLHDLANLEMAAHGQDAVAISDTCHRLSAKMAQIGLTSLYIKLKTVERETKLTPGFHFNKVTYLGIKKEIEIVLEKIKGSVIA